MTLIQEKLEEFKDKFHFPIYISKENVHQWLTQALEDVAKESRQEVIVLRSDIARAIGHMQGCGHPDKYLESKYPEFKELKQKIEEEK